MSDLSTITIFPESLTGEEAAESYIPYLFHQPVTFTSILPGINSTNPILKLLRLWSETGISFNLHNRLHITHGDSMTWGPVVETIFHECGIFIRIRAIPEGKSLPGTAFNIYASGRRRTMVSHKCRLFFTMIHSDVTFMFDCNIELGQPSFKDTLQITINPNDMSHLISNGHMFSNDIDVKTNMTLDLMKEEASVVPSSCELYRSALYCEIYLTGSRLFGLSDMSSDYDLSIPCDNQEQMDAIFNCIEKRPSFKTTIGVGLCSIECPEHKIHIKIRDRAEIQLLAKEYATGEYPQSKVKDLDGWPQYLINVKDEIMKIRNGKYGIKNTH